MKTRLSECNDRLLFANGHERPALRYSLSLSLSLFNPSFELFIESPFTFARGGRGFSDETGLAFATMAAR